MFCGLDGHVIGQPEILFPKLESALAEQYRKKHSGAQPDFGRFAIRVGRVQSVQVHPEAAHLFILSVDLGEEQPRTVVAGLTKHYRAEELRGRSVLVLANLQAAELRGVLSRGMVLVCEKRNKQELLDGAAFVTGQLVEVAGQRVDHRDITLDEFKRAPLRVADGRLLFDDQPCTVAGVPVTTSVLKHGKVG